MKQFKYWFFIFLSGLVLTACQTDLPNKPVQLTDFIPQEEVTQPTSKFIFPTDCEWKIVARIVDGDTIYTQDKTKVRFLGINTPEMHLKKDDSQNPDGQTAKEALEKMLQPKQKVCLMFDPHGDHQDKYGRLLAYLYNEQGTDINKTLITQGMAEYYRKAKYSRKSEFKKAEQIAHQKKVGLWKKGFISWQ